MSVVPKHACTRCKAQKRKCDKVLPQCSLCVRLNQSCEYSVTSLLPPVDSRRRTLADIDRPSIEEVWGPSSFKDKIIRGLSGIEPEAIASLYLSEIHPWFPIFSEDAWRGTSPTTWNDAEVGFVFLCSIISLLSSRPTLSEGDKKTSLQSEPRYFSGKSWLSLLEAAGFNSLEMVQSRLLMTLYEALHGQYPAAYISIGATVRAADALTIHWEEEESLLQPKTRVETERKLEHMMTWYAIVVVDRYIAMENGRSPSVTRGRKFPEVLRPMGSSFLEAGQTCHSMFTLFEASTLLDRLHTALYEPVLQPSFNVEEMAILQKTLASFEIFVCQETRNKSRLDTSSLALSSTGMLLLYDNGSKKGSSGDEEKQCWAGSLIALEALLKDILRAIEPTQEDKVASNALPLTPFAIYLIYKAAAIFTERLRMGHSLEHSIQSLSLLRSYLKLIGQRWYSGGRFLKLLDEDSTPRMLKALNQREV